MERGKVLTTKLLSQGYQKTKLSSNIPSAPAYGVYVSQLIRYTRACSNYIELHGAWESAHYKVFEPGVSKNQTGSNT